MGQKDRARRTFSVWCRGEGEVNAMTDFAKELVSRFKDDAVSSGLRLSKRNTPGTLPAMEKL